MAKEHWTSLKICAPSLPGPHMCLRPQVSPPGTEKFVQGIKALSLLHQPNGQLVASSHFNDCF